MRGPSIVFLCRCAMIKIETITGTKMSRKPCPFANEECKYWDRPIPPELRRQGQEHGCFSDLDHIVPRRLGTTALARAYINLPENKQQLCRELHDDKTRAGDEPLPNEGYMLAALSDADALGVVPMSKHLRRKMFNEAA